MDVETTGLKAGHHDILEICILPLNNNFEPNLIHKMFHMQLQPRRPENVDYKAMDVNKIEFYKICQNGIDPYKAADILDNWFDSINLPMNKKLMPLAQNWPFDRSFLIDWLGDLSFERIFHPYYRDTMAASIFLNDRSERLGLECPYPKHNLTYLCSQLKIPRSGSHNALEDCLSTAQVYRRLVEQAL